MAAPSRARVLSVARVVVAVVVLAAVVWAVARNWSDVSVHLGKISAPVFALSSLAAAVGLVELGGLDWRLIFYFGGLAPLLLARGRLLWEAAGDPSPRWIESLQTAAPQRPNSTAMPLPMPDPPPVTMTTSSANVPSGNIRAPSGGALRVPCIVPLIVMI